MTPREQTAEEVGAEEMASEAEIQQMETYNYQILGMGAQQARTAAEQQYHENWLREQGRGDEADEEGMGTK